MKGKTLLSIDLAGNQIRSHSQSLSLSGPCQTTSDRADSNRQGASIRREIATIVTKTPRSRCRQPHQRRPPRPPRPPLTRFDASPSFAALRRARGPSSGRPPWRSVPRWRGGASDWCTEVRKRGGVGRITGKMALVFDYLLDLLSFSTSTSETFPKQNQQAATSA